VGKIIVHLPHPYRKQHLIDTGVYTRYLAVLARSFTMPCGAFVNLTFSTLTMVLDPRSSTKQTISKRQLHRHPSSRQILCLGWLLRAQLAICHIWARFGGQSNAILRLLDGILAPPSITTRSAGVLGLSKSSNSMYSTVLMTYSFSGLTIHSAGTMHGKSMRV
jgi:hypothetical protein